MSDEKFEVEVEDDGPEIEIVDDTPEEDRDRQPGKPVEVTDDEISQYSDNVQKRIRELRRAYHDERREKERAAREHAEAIRFAQTIAEQNKALQERLSNGEKFLIETAKAKTEAELSGVEREYKEAYESGDTEKLLVAQKKLNEVFMNKREVERYQPTLQTPQVNVQSELPRVVPDDRTRQWVSNNQWFETDPVMRGAAFGVHDDLVRRGYVAGSDVYFEQIDARIREEFPHKFSTKRAANVVAPASRSAAGHRKVTLTKTQVALAKRLGIPLEKYAEQVAKEQGNV